MAHVLGYSAAKEHKKALLDKAKQPTVVHKLFGKPTSRTLVIFKCELHM